MRSFLIKSSVFLFLLLGTITVVFFKADGHTDPFYVRFTAPKQTSLILGTSKAAQGLRPSILNEKLNRNDIFNYAFTLRISPYGPVYLESIKNKLKKNSNGGIFILAVDTWSIFTDTDTPNNPETFKENSRFLPKITIPDANPNINYLLSGYEDMYVKILYNKSFMFLNDNGWLEVYINNYKNKLISTTTHRSFYFDSLRHVKHFEASITRYLNKTKTYKYSQLRLEYLKKTIKFLKTRGEVYLVRLPVHNDMIEIENSIMSDFNSTMTTISNDFSIDYYDLTYLNSSCNFNDANHLNRESTTFVSKELAKKINKE